MTTSDQLLAAGVPIRLLDGRSVNLRYTMRGLKALEDAFGSVSAVQTAISNDGTGKQFGPFLTVLRCGLHHEGFATDDDLIDLIDLHRLAEYGEAISAAFAQAFPQADEDDAPEGRPNLPTTPLDGLGASGTTPPRSSLAAMTGVSG